MKFLIAGLGSIGRRHMRNLLDLGQRDIILFRTHRSTLPEDDLQGFPTETELDIALSHGPDAVIVSNPTSLHLEVAIPAAKAGCHLLIEKPISHSLERVDELRKAVEDGGGKVLVGYQYRFHPGLQKINDLLKAGEIGRPLTVRAHWGEYLPGWHPWEDYQKGYSARSDLGGGVILTLSHPLDYLRWLLGDILDVWSFTGMLGELVLDVEDTAEIGIRFSSGVLGSVHLDYNQQPPYHYLNLVGTNGTIHWEYSHGGVRLFNTDEEDWVTFPIPANFDRNDMFVAEMEHFLSIVQGKVEPICSLLDGIQVLKLIQAAKRSANIQEKIQLD